jgi:hypothetical protein
MKGIEGCICKNINIQKGAGAETETKRKITQSEKHN